MSSDEERKEDLLSAITIQANLVRELKQNCKDNSNADLGLAIEKLKSLKLQLQEIADEPNLDQLRRQQLLEDLLLRKMYVIPSFEIYGGVAGFMDFGPPGCALKNNLLNVWRQHFVVEDSMLQIECSNLMPEIVLKTSGHVDKFTDLMVKDNKTGECYRADKLIEDHISRVLDSEAGQRMEPSMQEHLRVLSVQAESMSAEDTDRTIKELGIVSPGRCNSLSFPTAFNLMFSSRIGPENGQLGYLRPETAQGIFINFRRLLEFNGGRLPFAAAQIGYAFRNEISPRAGLLRVREFQQAEIEHFVHPLNKSHAKFCSIQDDKLVLLSKTKQLQDGKTFECAVHEAVNSGVINNETLGYYMARTNSFVNRIGIPKERVRFRQHLDTEMAHYAADCWDLEILINGSWVECAGHADRSCFDLQAHSAKSKVEMVGTLKYPSPREVRKVKMEANKGVIGKQFRKEASIVFSELEEMVENLAEAEKFESTLAELGVATLGPNCSGKVYNITREMVKFSIVTEVVSEEKFSPSVIEPSYGIGRLLTAVFDSNFYSRMDDEKRVVMSFTPEMAPIKVSVLPLSTSSSLLPHTKMLEEQFLAAGITVRADLSSVAIGRKYARADELGIPFNVTVDFETVTSYSVTIRERDSREQFRLPLRNVVNEVISLVNNKVSWKALTSKYQLVDNASKHSQTKVCVTSRGSFRRPC